MLAVDRAARLSGDGCEAGVAGEVPWCRESLDVTDLGEDPGAGPYSDSREAEREPALEGGA